jgi:hypothetical protein
MVAWPFQHVVGLKSKKEPSIHWALKQSDRRIAMSQHLATASIHNSETLAPLVSFLCTLTRSADFAERCPIAV